MGQTDRQTNGRTPDRYITLIAKRRQSNKSRHFFRGSKDFQQGKASWGSWDARRRQ